MTPARNICDLLQARTSSGRQAFEIVDAVFAKIIAILRRRFGIGHLEAELLFADVIREHEGIVFNALRDCIPLDDAEDAVRLCLGDEQ
jgi:hypothetical protein